MLHMLLNNLDPVNSAYFTVKCFMLCQGKVDISFYMCITMLIDN
jgi:hypothetical protein